MSKGGFKWVLKWGLQLPGIKLVVNPILLFHSIIPLDSSEAGGANTQSALQRSFNLMRLRAIEVQRNLAANNFYQEELNLQNDQSTMENNNGHNGSVDNALLENGVRSSSVASRHRLVNLLVQNFTTRWG